MAITLQPDFSPSPVSGGSAQLKFVPPSAPKQNSQPAPKPQNTPTYNPTTVSTGGSGGYQVGGWYGGRQWDGSRFGNPGEIIVGNNSGGGQQSNYDPYAELRAEADRAANASLDVLNKHEEYLKGEDYNAGVADINREYDFVIGQAQRRQEDAQNQVKVDSEGLAKSYEKAQNDAIRSFNALQQRARVLFGRGSSAGQAGTEIAQQAYYQEQGNVSEAFIREEGILRARAAEISRTYDETMKEADFMKSSMMSQLKKNLNDRLMQIAQQKSLVEQQRSQMRIAVLQDAVNFTRQIQAFDAQLRANIKQAAEEKMLNLNNDYNSIAQNYQVDTSSKPYIQFSTNPQDYGSITYQSPNSVYSLLARKNAQEQDELENTNPFYA